MIVVLEHARNTEEGGHDDLPADTGRYRMYSGCGRTGSSTPSTRSRK